MTSIGGGGQPARAEAGVLYVVPTPIGNLRDVTLRALDILGSVDVIAAEDTRRTGQLLKLHGVERAGRMVSCHEHNEARRASQVASELSAGRSVALVTNAGMPTVSDPGFRAVRAAIEAGRRVEVLPGASAVPAALAGSGLAVDRFAFLGFVPKKPGARGRFLEGAAGRAETVVFFESPERLARTLREAVGHFGPERRAAVCRELSKVHEEFARGPLEDLVSRFEAAAPKGEITVLVAGRPD
ncbi:MAG: 16S rRNA (cytidine(1402)-2'-O)-methyltransferase [Planctomycetota bacterium]|jgi:16S rRNA (cytidine1402-2'-O)-methyltransferase